MRYVFIIGLILFLSSCKGSKTYHTVKVTKPINHKGYYKDSRWHRKLQVGRIRVRLFEKQGVKTVRMKG